MPIALPIDDVLAELVASLRVNPNLVLEAPPGAGKTTRVPVALIDQNVCPTGEIIVLEPRRLAARLSARRVAEERGERLGDSIGYQVRFDEVASAATRVRYVTEGVLTRRLLSDPMLKNVAAVVLDEFHERHLQGDVALSLLRALQRAKRPELRLIVMSATLDAAPVAGFLGDAPRVRSEGKRFEVAIEHLPRPDERPLAQLVASAVRQLVADGLDGDVLVFLPGAAEIRRAREAVEPIAARSDLAVHALHGDLSPAEQDRAIGPSARRKVILSTNVAETSVTIDGVVAVIDSGLARIAGHSPWSGLSTLKVSRISRASAAQRAGRAGRTRPGRCLRLYTKHDHDTRPTHDAPEVQRLDLAETALELHAAGVTDLARFGWFEAPAAPSLKAADELLEALGALGSDGALTPIGRKMLKFPVHPRVARMLLEAASRGIAEFGCTAAALLSEREILSARRAGGLNRGGAGVTNDNEDTSDVEAAVALFEEATRHGVDANRAISLGLDPGAVAAAERVRKQLGRLVEPRRGGADHKAIDASEELRMSILTAFPDRVARRLKGREYTLVNGGTAALAPTSAVHDREFLCALDAEERTEPGARGASVRSACAIEPEWLLELFPESVREVPEAVWNAENERADAVVKLMYRGLLLDTSRGGARGAEAASKLLGDKAVAKGARSFAEEGALDRWIARVAFVAESAPETGVKPLAEGDVDRALRALCEGRRSFDELRGAELLRAVKDALPGEQRRAVETMAPERVTLPGGRGVQVQYELSRRPWIESRLQDFFGMAVGPSVAAGRVSLVLHLLAPNHRAVQVTTDLAGFWERHYPGIRRELCRKYPRHPWPDDGRTATPPPPKPQRK